MKETSHLKECFSLFLIYPILCYIGLPGANTIVSLLFILLYLKYFYTEKHFRQIAFSKPMVIWLLLTIFHWWNAIEKEVPEVNFIDLLHGLKIYSCLVIFCFWGTNDFKKTVNTLFFTFTFYIIIAFFICDFDESERMSGVIYTTQLGQTVGMYALYIVYKSHFKNYSILDFSKLFVLPCIIVALSQSRNSLLLVGISYMACIFDLYFLRQRFSTSKKVMSFIVLSILILIILPVIAESAVFNRIGEMNEVVSESHFYKENGTGTVFDFIVGDRLVYYITGWTLFLQSPITGIGMWNYRFITGGTFPLHSEFMVHLCEGGLIASILYVCFIIMVIINISRYKYERGVRVIAYISVASILICGIWARVFFYEFFYPVYGLALSLAYQKTKI